MRSSTVQSRVSRANSAAAPGTASRAVGRAVPCGLSSGRAGETSVRVRTRSGRDRGNPGGHRAAERVAEQMDRPVSFRLEVTDDGPGETRDGEVAVVGRRRVAEARQVDGIPLDGVGQCRHQRRPVLRGAAESVDEQRARQPGPHRRVRAQRHRHAGQRDLTQRLAVARGRPAGGRHHRGHGRPQVRLIGRRHAAMLRGDHPGTRGGGAFAMDRVRPSHSGDAPTVETDEGLCRPGRE